MDEKTTEKHQHKKLTIIIFLIILILGAVIARFTKIPSTEKPAQKYNIATEGNFWIGSAQPIVTIVEFSDFSCPYCKNSAITLKNLRNLYPGKIKIIYKDYIGHENSYALALAARCAGEQGAFWLMHDELFSKQDGFLISDLPKQATALGINQERFQRCYNGEYYKEQTASDNSEAKKLEISGTPTFFVNGYKVYGDISLDSWKQIIDKFLE